MTFYVVLTAINLISMIIASEYARRKGLNHRYWFLGAAVLGPLVFPLLFFRRSKA